MRLELPRYVAPRRVLVVAASLFALAVALGAWGAWPVEPVGPEQHARHLGALRPEMVVIPAGTYTVGSPPDEPGRNDDEERRTVVLGEQDRFAIAATEVTQAQWQAVMGGNPSFFQGERGGGPDHPVESVNWYEAVEYLNRLSVAEGLEPCYVVMGCRGTLGGGCENEIVCTSDYECEDVEFRAGCTGYRLPTEDEWEIGARAGTTTTVYTGSVTLRGERDAPELGPIAWYGGNSDVRQNGVDCRHWPGKQYPSLQCGTHPVAQKIANAWSLYDVIGNVWEWTDTKYGEGRAVRGCDWHESARGCRASSRLDFHPVRRDGHFGLRPARSWRP